MSDFRNLPKCLTAPVWMVTGVFIVLYGMPAGRPPIWKDPEAFEKATEAYFADQEIKHTWTGLSLHLGFAGREGLWEYSKKPEFSNSVKKALSRIETIYEERLGTNKATGAIFALKNFGWKDKQEIDHTVKDWDVSLNLDGRKNQVRPPLGAGISTEDIGLNGSEHSNGSSH